jgi:uncharacterized protein (DUF2164 family)
MKKNLLKKLSLAAALTTLCNSNTLQAQAGAALNFDGVNDYVNLGTVISTSLSNTQALTIESWVRPSISTNGNIVSNHFSGTQFSLRQQGSQFNFFVGFGTYTLNTAVSTVTLNTWQHVAGVFNGTSLSIYINGALASTTTCPSYTFGVSSNNVWIGNNGFNEYFNGNMDEVRIWNVARTQCQINTFMNCEIPTTATGLLVNYHFNQGIAAASNTTVTTLTDASASSITGTLTNFALTGTGSNWITPGGVVSGFTTPTTCPVGEALNFDGGNDYVNIGASLNTTLSASNKITVEAWVRPNTNSGFGIIVGNYNTPPSNTGMQFLLRRDGANYTFWTDNGSGFNTVTSAATVTLGTWQHVAGTWDGSVMRIYVNGTPSGTLSVSGTSLVANTNQIWLGGRPAGTEYFNGSIDETRIWNVARTQCEINTFRNCEIPTTATGILANYHFNQGIAAASNPTVTSLIDASASAITGSLTNFGLNGSNSNWVAPGGVISGFTTSIAPPSYSSSPLSVCNGNTVSLTATGATTFTWSGGITNGTAFTPTASTGYTFTGTNTLTSCSNTAAANVTVNPIPTILVVSNNTVLCVGQTASLTASGAATYSWNTSATTSVIAVSPTVNATYTVTGTSAAGCSNVATITQTVSTCTGIDALTGTLSFPLNVYPNPSNGVYIVDATSPLNISIIDVLGKVVYTVKLEDGSRAINLSQLNSGLYILKAENNGAIKTTRLIKE